jgi:signal transduction histidine kinase/CheY-like chemotaxis protein
MTISRIALLTVDLRYEHDVVGARQRSRQLAAMLGFSHQEQTRISTAVSEIARNAIVYARGGRLEFTVEGRAPQLFVATISDSGPGIPNIDEILAGRYDSETGMGLGLIGAKRLMDYFRVESPANGGTRVVLGKKLPTRIAALGPTDLARMAAELERRQPESPVEELQQQNRELMETLHDLRDRQAELQRLNEELEDTNRGVVALYAELDERADYLQRASDLKTRFISNMSHEFKTPLNAILSLTRLLLDKVDGDLNDEQLKQVQYVRKSTQDLYELVNDLLDLAKVEAGKIVVRPHEFDVATLFSALRGMLRPLLVTSSVDLVFEDPVDIPPIMGDESKISQILRNFISNALKFTEKGHVRVCARRQGGSVVFEVEDTGLGIAPEDQGRIFEEWVQLENPLQKRHKGTGLGLPLSKRLAELMGGRVWVRSEPGIGSSFFAELPLRYADAPQETEELKIDPTRPPVLVVEDNRETLMVYEKFLARAGYQMISASTLSAARRFLRRFRPAAILLDILLHDESTWTFLTEVKSDASTRGTPVFVVTLVENEAKARALGADEFCIKPLEEGWLSRKLADHAAGRSAKLLIIDDDEPSRYAVKASLQRFGYAVLEAPNGEVGVQLARSERPTAILLDLVMPEMNGYEVLRALKANQETRNVPVVVHTGKFLDEQERRYLLQDAVAVVPKSSSAAATDQLITALNTAGIPIARTVEHGS